MHISDLIHKVGGFDKFRELVQKSQDNPSLDERYSGDHAASTDASSNLRDTELIPNGQSEIIHVLQKKMQKMMQQMMQQMKQILGKDEETNIFKAVNKSNENLGRAIAL